VTTIVACLRVAERPELRRRKRETPSPGYGCDTVMPWPVRSVRWRRCSQSTT